MYLNNKILVGKNKEKEACILLNKANRHGLITGASGTGKTITLKVMAESFSSAGVPVFLADVKGDLAGTAKKGEASESVVKRIEELNIPEFDIDYVIILGCKIGSDGSLTPLLKGRVDKAIEFSKMQKELFA